MFVENVGMSVANIVGNKMRTFLTTLGIIIGVAAIIALMTVVQGATGERVAAELPGWAFGPFVRPEGVNPVIFPNKESVFDCPMRKRPLKWEESDTFNPAAAVKDGKIVVLYRAEDNTFHDV